MSQTQLLDDLLNPLIKPALLLKLSNSEQAEHASCASKFGGLPYAEANETWASCPTCKNELTFVAQIKLPAENSLHTFFYCFDCFPWGFGNEEKGQWLIRSYQNPNMANYVAIAPSHVSEYEIPACTCTEQSVKTLPDFNDLEVLSPEAAQIFSENDRYEDYEVAAAERGCLTDYATFIGGYPKWIQSETTKVCAICGDEMAFFAQIDSEDNADVMWGDSGAVYLFRCAAHKNEFALELQCY